MTFSSQRFFERKHKESFLGWLLRKIFVEEWFLKIIALTITAALWIGVNGFRETRRLERVSINLRAQDDIAITSAPKQEVDLFVTGDRRELARLDPHDLGPSVEIAGTETGDRIVQLSPDVISSNLPSGIRITDVQPQKIAVRLERVLVRELPLQIETIGTLPAGYELYDAVPSLPKIRVRGAESRVSPLIQIQTESVDISGRTQDFVVRQIGLVFSQPDVSILDSIVNVNFKIGESRIERTFVLGVGGDSSGKTATVTVRAPHAIFEQVNFKDLKLSQVRNPSGELQPKLSLPSELSDRVQIKKVKFN